MGRSFLVLLAAAVLAGGAAVACSGTTSPGLPAVSATGGPTAAMSPSPTATAAPTPAGTTTPTPTSLPTPPSTPTAAPTPTASVVPTPAPTPTPAARWVPAGEMELARSSFAAVPLPGGTVLVVGHDNTCTPGGAWDDSVKAEVYSPAGDSWKATSPLPDPRDGFSSVRLQDGRVLVAGGLTATTDTAAVAYSSARVYDADAGKWTKPGLMHVARYQPSAALLADGRVLVAGGIFTDGERYETRSSAELFDPASDTWTTTGSMKAARSGAKAVTLGDGRVLLVGGRNADDQVLRSAEIFDPETGRWSSAGSMSTTRNAFTLTLLPDGTVLAVGGDAEGSWAGGQPLSSVDRFDPGSGAWSRAASTNTPRAAHVAALLGDGRLLVAGGNDRRLTLPSNPDEGFPDPTGSAEIYDPVSDSWIPTVALTTPRAGASAVALPDGSVLVVGGYGSWGPMSTPYCPDELASAERYVPAGG